MGEIDTNLPQLISETTGDATTFGFDDDDAPAIIVPNQTNPTTPAGPRPGPDDQSVRNLVGPGIENLGETSQICTDHADARPTLMTLLRIQHERGRLLGYQA